MAVPLTPAPQTRPLQQDVDDGDDWPPSGPPPSHIDSALESLGKAITDPVRDAAEEEDPALRRGPAGSARQ